VLFKQLGGRVKFIVFTKFSSETAARLMQALDVLFTQHNPKKRCQIELALNVDMIYIFTQYGD